MTDWGEAYSPSQRSECGTWFMPDSPDGCMVLAWDSPVSPTHSDCGLESPSASSGSEAFLSDPTSDEADMETVVLHGRRASPEEVDWSSVGIPRVQGKGRAPLAQTPVNIPTLRVAPYLGDPRRTIMVNMVVAKLTLPGGTSFEETTRRVRWTG